MSPETAPQGADTIIASIENQADSRQRIDIRYVRGDNVFVTRGIQAQFAEKEISIPGHLVVMDFQLIGVIISEILEKLSRAKDGETTFEYASLLHVLDKVYRLEDGGEYMVLSAVESE